ncbi:hypothetical protein LU290_00365 [Moraxella nasibovis]|uniref:hypothetical protein n=1 Tax=Moraxella nasibovis TaxID=2904120 RepID=UPI0024108F93|nr:hypothetical protein [Moraxella nasibovis]WFF38738.1 hypothetical protein LU290_00365 [Moraxella nasibovis]
MLLINSAAYVGPEFQAEVGVIPPCMLPIGNKKIIELQVAKLREVFGDEKIVLSLPKSYKLAINEANVLAELNIKTRYVPDEFTLAEAILYVLNTETDSFDEQIRLLHGDTLISDIPKVCDVLTISKFPRAYNWQKEKLPTGEEVIWNGYFCFSDRLNFIKSLAIARGDFVKAVNHYRETHAVELYETKDWHDCGHINPYFNARATITTQRSFNSLLIDDGAVTKSSTNHKKMQAEINWFKSLPASLRKFTPQFIEEGIGNDGVTPYYCLEFMPILPLNELYVHGRNPAIFWRKIFSLVKDYFEKARNADAALDKNMEAIISSSDRLYKDKTLSRIAKYAEEVGLNLNKQIVYQNKALGSINDIVNDSIQKTLNLPCVATIMHGDLCFSNMLFDARGQRIKLIDPRGIDEDDNLTILGNQTYDLAKLTHSVIGMYDFIIAGRYRLVENVENSEIEFDVDERLSLIQQEYLDTIFFEDITVKQVMPAVVLLFLSMLPLHDDRPDRQKAMLTNAFRLYHDFVL